MARLREVGVGAEGGRWSPAILEDGEGWKEKDWQWWWVAVGGGDAVGRRWRLDNRWTRDQRGSGVLWGGGCGTRRWIHRREPPPIGAAGPGFGRQVFKISSSAKTK
jgi:hypothetical protein